MKNWNISTTREKHTKAKPENTLKEYLLGDNENLIGTVIAIRKSLIKSNLDKFFEQEINDPNHKHYVQNGYAILLYFDHGNRGIPNSPIPYFPGIKRRLGLD